MTKTYPQELPLLMETVRLEDGKPQHVSFHNERMNRSRGELFDANQPLDLATAIEEAVAAAREKPPQRSRCRVLYDREVRSVTWEVLGPRHFQSFSLISSEISYDHKFLDRTELNGLKEMAPESDDIIIVRQGLITDTTIANLAFYDGTDWLTPGSPLLRGTARERYLKEGRIREADIGPGDVQGFKKIALLNALLDFYVIDPPMIDTKCD